MVISLSKIKFFIFEKNSKYSKNEKNVNMKNKNKSINISNNNYNNCKKEPKLKIISS